MAEAKQFNDSDVVSVGGTWYQQTTDELALFVYFVDGSAK